jgi:large subunit ribosomal protein L7/L12
MDKTQLIEAIEKMSVLELSELVKALEEKFGVSASAPMMMAAMPMAGAPAAAAEEKTEFDIELTDAGAQKIEVIKAVKTALSLGLSEAKALVDGAPAMLKTAMPKAEAEALKKAVETAGGKVTLK